MDRLLNEREAAPIVGLSVSTLQKLRCRGGGPRYRKLSKAVRYSEDDLKAWVDERAVHSTSEKIAA